MAINTDDRVEISLDDRRYLLYGLTHLGGLPAPLVVGRMIQESDVTKDDLFGDLGNIPWWGPEVDLWTYSPDLEIETISRIERDLHDRAEKRDWEELGWDYLDEVLGEGWRDGLMPDDLLEAFDEHEEDSSSQ